MQYWLVGNSVDRQLLYECSCKCSYAIKCWCELGWLWLGSQLGHKYYSQMCKKIIITWIVESAIKTQWCVVQPRKNRAQCVLYVNQNYTISACCISENIQAISTKFIVYVFYIIIIYTTSHAKFERNLAICLRDGYSF